MCKIVLPFFLSVLLCLGLSGCSPNQGLLLEQLIRQSGGLIQSVAERAEEYHLQIRYTQIDRDSLGRPSFRTFSLREHSLREDSSAYFYPASTVKLPVVALALELCRELGLDPTWPMLTDSAGTTQSPAWRDSSAENGYPSVAHYAKKILLVSDNDAFNRLYEFVGPARIHLRMTELGFPDTRIVHRLSLSLSRRANQHLNPLYFLSADGKDTLLRLPARWDSLPPSLTPDVLIGKGEMVGGKLVNGPKDFSDKNYFPLRDQQEFLKQIFFLDHNEQHALRLNTADRALMIQYLGMTPRESSFPRYDNAIYPDGYVKFFLFGDSHAPIPPDIRVYNKVGIAYGWVTDNAYIVDQTHGIEFLLSATMWTNENQVFNDDRYEYDEVALPFMAELGSAILAHERERAKGRILH